MNLPTEAFSNKSEYYAEFRPTYSESLLAFITERCGLTADFAVADLGSGTGTLASMFLPLGNTVYAVEPNADMRRTAEAQLGGHDGFVSVDATAEATTLPADSVNLVTAGRAMQWFDVPAALEEIARILRPGGWAIGIWNELEPSPMVSEYRDILRTFGKNHDLMAGKRQAARDLLDDRGFRLDSLANPKPLTLAKLKGLVLSLASTPRQGAPRHEAMMRAVEEVFAKYQQDGQVRFDFTTMVYSSQTPT